MLKNIMFITTLTLSSFLLVACASEPPANEPIPVLIKDIPEIIPQLTPEELRANFETFFETRRESIINAIATDGEDVRLTLGDDYDFIMTILLDDIQLDETNRPLYALTFEMTFSDMGDLFGRIANDIMIDANLTFFRLTVVFIDVNEAEIARSNFDAGSRLHLGLEIIEFDEDEDATTPEETVVTTAP